MQVCCSAGADCHERDRKLDVARKHRQIRRQQAAWRVHCALLGGGAEAQTSGLATIRTEGKKVLFPGKLPQPESKDIRGAPSLNPQTSPLG
jgi:hypothetical protein